MNALPGRLFRLAAAGGWGLLVLAAACGPLWAQASPAAVALPEQAVEDERAPAEAPAFDPAAAPTEGPAPISSLLDGEAARLQALLETIESRRAAVAKAREEEEAAHAADVEALVSLREQVRAAAAGSPDADLLYDRLVAGLGPILRGLEEALDRWRHPVEATPVRLELDAAVRATPAYASRAASLQQQVDAAAGAGEQLAREEAEARWVAVDLRGARFEQYGAARTECLEKVSALKRDALLSFLSEAGIRELRREARQLALTTKLYGARRFVEIGRISSWADDLLHVGTLAWGAVQLGALVLVLIWARRGLERGAEKARRALFPRLRSLRGKRMLESAVGALQVVAPWTLFLIGLVVTRRILGAFAARPVFSVLFTISYVYGVYRLGIDSAYALLLHAANRYRLALDGRRRTKILASVRSVARLLAALAIVLPVSGRLLGKGFLYNVVADLAWILGLLIAFRLLRGWREVICETYLAIAPQGLLAGAVRRSRERWYGFFVAGASFVWLAGSGAAALAKDFALGFDQTRKALSFIFLRRVQKQAEQRGYAQSRQEDLPPALVAAFDEAPVSGNGWVVDHFPGLDSLGGLLDEWRAGRGAGALAITGEPGVGKTSWLAQVPAEGIQRTDLTLQDRPRNAAALAELLSRELLGDERRTADPRVLAESLKGGTPRIVTLDIAQNLFLKRVGGYEAFSCLANLIDATAAKVFWICSFNAFGWQHLAAVRPDLSVFRKHHVLPAWSEERIRDLVRARLASSGVEATYEDLVVDRMEGVSARATLLHTEEGYTRLLWDYADGNPRVALHFWLRSVVPESERRVRVRLFRAPEPQEIEQAGEPALIVLASIVNHENLTLEECREVTGYGVTLCRIHLERLRQCGALALERGRYRVSTRWQRAAIRLLRRRNLLAD